MAMAYEMGPLWGGELFVYYDAMIVRMNDMKQANVKNFDGIYRATSK